MKCEGFERSEHEVDRLYAKGFCVRCYQRKYRSDHHTEIAKYQAEYCADSAYKLMRCEYMKIYRKRG